MPALSSFFSVHDIKQSFDCFLFNCSFPLAYPFGGDFFHVIVTVPESSMSKKAAENKIKLKSIIKTYFKPQKGNIRIPNIILH